MTEDAENLVRYTAKELLARLDVKLDELNRKFDEKMANMEKRLQSLEGEREANAAVRSTYIMDYQDFKKDHESRLRTIERKIWVMAGAAAAGGGAASAVTSFLIGG